MSGGAEPLSQHIQISARTEQTHTSVIQTADVVMSDHARQAEEPY